MAITKRVKGEYTEEFQDRWAEYVRGPKRSERWIVEPDDAVGTGDGRTVEDIQANLSPSLLKM